MQSDEYLKIDFPSKGSKITAVVGIHGYVNVPNLAHYKILVGEGINPSDWELLGDGKENITGQLCFWYPSSSEGYFLLKIVAEDDFNNIFECCSAIKLNSDSFIHLLSKINEIQSSFGSNDIEILFDVLEPSVVEAYLDDNQSGEYGVRADRNSIGVLVKREKFDSGTVVIKLDKNLFKEKKEGEKYVSYVLRVFASGVNNSCLRDFISFKFVMGEEGSSRKNTVSTRFNFFDYIDIHSIVMSFITILIFSLFSHKWKLAIPMVSYGAICSAVIAFLVCINKTSDRWKYVLVNCSIYLLLAVIFYILLR